MRTLLCKHEARLALLALTAVALLVPASAQASGSWAVPRFTPTWAELERDLEAMGGKKRRGQAVARKAPTRRATGTGTGTGTTVGTAAVEGTQTTTGTGQEATVATTGTGTGAQTASGTDSAGTVAATGTQPPCQCPPPTQLVCPDVVPAGATAEPAGGVKEPVKKKVKKGAPKPPAEDKKKLERKKYWWQEE
jgi:hypothetical protein